MWSGWVGYADVECKGVSGGKKKRAVRHTLGPPTLWVPLCSSSPTAMVFASTCCHHRRLRYDYPSFVVAFAVVVVWSYSSLLGLTYRHWVGFGAIPRRWVIFRRYPSLLGRYWDLLVTEKVKGGKEREE
jgi:hypothetical protein